MALLSQSEMASAYLIKHHSRRLKQTTRSLLGSPCATCRRKYMFQYLHQRRTLRHVMRETAATRSKIRRADERLQAEKRIAQQAREHAKKPRLPVNPPIQKEAQARPQPLQKSKSKEDVPQEFAPSDSPAARTPVAASSTTKNPATKSPTAKAHVASKISKTWPQRITRQQIRGLNNPANWCYRRSLQQALYCVPQFFNILDKHKVQHTKQHNCVSCALARSFESYHSNAKDLQGAIGSLDKVIRETGRKSDPSWRATGQSQEDSHDFLHYLLGTVEKASGIPKQHFEQTFHIREQAEWTCQKCSKKHTHLDPAEYSLSLPIWSSKGNPTLATCMDRYHQEDQLTIRCDKCHKNMPRTRIKKIVNPPDALYIQFKRFAMGLGRQGRKINRHVAYPEKFDLAPWSLEKKDTHYRLQAVVAHSGGLKTGHYIAYVRGPNGVHVLNDESARSVAAAEWLQPKGFDPYILLYTKV